MGILVTRGGGGRALLSVPLYLCRINPTSGTCKVGAICGSGLDGPWGWADRRSPYKEAIKHQITKAYHT